MNSPTARSLAWLRRQGWVAFVVERWNPHANIRQDLGGFADIIAWDRNSTLAVQATTGPNASARLAKIAGLETASSWFDGPRSIEIHAWAKRGPRGKRKTWTLRRIVVSWRDGHARGTDLATMETEDPLPYPMDRILPDYMIDVRKCGVCGWLWNEPDLYGDDSPPARGEGDE